MTQRQPPIQLTEDDYHAFDNGGVGVCLECRETDAQDGWCEPDAEGYVCVHCGAHAVTGVSNALMMDEIEIVDDYD